MSIVIDYSTPGLMVIRCGDERMAVPLRGPATAVEAAPPQATPPSPETEPDAPTVSPAPPPPTRDQLPEHDRQRRIGMPDPFPGVMGIVTIDGRRQRVPPDRWWPWHGQRWPIFPFGRPPMLSLAVLSVLPRDDLAERLARLRGEYGLMPGAPFLLDIAVNPQPGGNEIDVAMLQALVDDPAAGVDAIRLNFLDEPEPD